MKKAWVLFKLAFFSVFGTTKNLENAEADIEYVFGAQKKPAAQKAANPPPPAEKP